MNRRKQIQWTNRYIRPVPFVLLFLLHIMSQASQGILYEHVVFQGKAVTGMVYDSTQQWVANVLWPHSGKT